MAFGSNWRRVKTLLGIHWERMKDLSQDQFKQSIIALFFILSPVYFSLFHILMEWYFFIRIRFENRIELD